MDIPLIIDAAKLRLIDTPIILSRIKDGIEFLNNLTIEKEN